MIGETEIGHGSLRVVFALNSTIAANTTMQLKIYYIGTLVAGTPLNFTLAECMSLSLSLSLSVLSTCVRAHACLLTAC
jgi:hypothetical protein